jgi:hypothetical protein
MCGVGVRQLLATIPAARKLQMYDVGAGVLLRELEDPQDDSTGRQRRAAYQVRLELGHCDPAGAHRRRRQLTDEITASDVIGLGNVLSAAWICDVWLSTFSGMGWFAS